MKIYQKQNVKVQMYMEGPVLSTFDSDNTRKIIKDGIQVSVKVELDDDLAPIIDIVALCMLGVMLIVGSLIVRKQKKKHGSSRLRAFCVLCHKNVRCRMLSMVHVAHAVRVHAFFV